MQIGDHLVTPRTGYTHHGLYLGNQHVIHYSGKTHHGQGSIQLVSLDEFCDGKACRVRDYPFRVYGRKESVERAEQRLGEAHYSILFNNCEQFVAWCIMGFGYSEQINTVVSATIQTKALMEKQGVKAVANYIAQSTLAENTARQVATAVVPTGTALVTGSAISGGTVALASGLSIASVTLLAVPITAGVIVGYGVKKLVDWVWD
nr:lecithin retinol acyltransferase family protein [uncultured Tolumonas sp.]